MTSPKPLAIFIGGLVLALALINILISSQVSYWGYELSQLNFQATSYSEANRLLVSDLSRQTSLTKIASQAPVLGYSANLIVQNLSDSSRVALTTLSQP